MSLDRRVKSRELGAEGTGRKAYRKKEKRQNATPLNRQLTTVNHQPTTDAIKQRITIDY